MKKILTFTLLATLFLTISVAHTAPIKEKKYTLQGQIIGAAKGDTLRFSLRDLRWIVDSEGSFDVVLSKEGKFKYKGKHPQTRNFSVTYHPCDTARVVASGSKSSSSLLISQGKHLINDKRENVFYLKVESELYGGLLNESIAIKDSVIMGRDAIRKKMKAAYAKQDTVKAKKFENSFNYYYSWEKVNRALARADSLERLYLDANSNDYVAFEVYNSTRSLNLDEQKKYYSQLCEETKRSYYGIALEKKIATLDLIQIGKTTPPFTLTTIKGDVVTDQDFRGQYLLIYKFGLCPGSMQMDPKLTKLYQENSDRLEVLGYTESIYQVRQYAKQVDPNVDFGGVNLKSSLDGMLSHPWKHDVNAAKTDPDLKLNDMFQMRGLPFVVLISPEGEIIARGFWEAYYEVEKIFAD